MEKLDASGDYPPAKAINQIEDEKGISYPIIRCEDCHELLTIKFIMTKKEISLICELINSLKQ